MTGITLTTVGYKEVRELDGLGRAWTVIVAIAGVGIIFGSVGIVAEAVLSEAVSGRTGGETDERGDRRAQGPPHPVWLRPGGLDRGARAGPRRRAVRRGRHQPGVVGRSARADGHLSSSATRRRMLVLREAGIERARGLITTIDSDANNVYVTLSARAMNPGLFVVARANQEGSEAKLAPGGREPGRVAVHARRPPDRRAGRPSRRRRLHRLRAVAWRADVRHRGRRGAAQNGPLDGATVGDAPRPGIFSLAVVRGDRDYEPNPAADGSWSRARA